MESVVKAAFLFIFLGLFAAMAASWLLFARLTMARIERDLKADGYPRPAPWDGVGGRAVWYAWAIALPVGPWNLPNDPMINVKLVRRYANRSDKVRAWALFISGNLLVLAVIVGQFIVELHGALSVHHSFIQLQPQVGSKRGAG